MTDDLNPAAPDVGELRPVSAPDRRRRDGAAYKDGPLLAQMAKAPALTGLSKSKIYRLMQAGLIRGVNIGRSSYVDMASVGAYIASLPSTSIRGAV